jgi:hypothetical protein
MAIQNRKSLPNGKSTVTRPPAPVTGADNVGLAQTRKDLKVASSEASQMYETENDISLKRRTEINALLNQRLADAVDLQMQMKQAHWNVKGPSFIGLHELFDKVAEAVESYVDMIAECAKPEAACERKMN